MKEKDTYEDLKQRLENTYKVCVNSQIDKEYLHKLIEYMKQENEQLKYKIRDLECMNNIFKNHSKEEVDNVIALVLSNYYYNFNN